jgi:hypothetical protein
MEVQVLSRAQEESPLLGDFLLAGIKLWESFIEDLKTFDNFIECTHEKKIEKVYRICKIQDSSPAHQISNLRPYIRLILMCFWCLIMLDKQIKLC